jgi:hypothetical protein
VAVTLNLAYTPAGIGTKNGEPALLSEIFGIITKSVNVIQSVDVCILPDSHVPSQYSIYHIINHHLGNIAVDTEFQLYIVKLTLADISYHHKIPFQLSTKNTS